MSNPWEVVDQASRMLGEAQQARRDIRDLLAELARQREDAAGVALWCSLGEHAFSNHDRKRATFTVETFDDEGHPVKEAHVSCGQCAAKRRAALQSQPAIPTGADAELYRQYLEWRNGMGPEPATPPGES
jgi:hypothetical protein